jgi:hypothetical protein
MITERVVSDATGLGSSVPTPVYQRLRGNLATRKLVKKVVTCSWGWKLGCGLLSPVEFISESCILHSSFEGYRLDSPASLYVSDTSDSTTGVTACLPDCQHAKKVPAVL